MRGCLRFTASIFGLIFVLTAALLLSVGTLAAVVVDPRSIESVLRGPVLQEAAREIFVASITDLAAAQGQRLGVDPTQVAASVEELLPPAWLEAQTGVVVDAMYSYWESGDPSDLTVTFDVGPPLQQLRGEPGRRAIADILGALPPCPPGTLPLNPVTGAPNIDNCLPEGVRPEEVAGLVQERVVAQVETELALRGGSTALTVTLVEPGAAVPALQGAPVGDARRVLLLARNLWVLWLIPLFCLLALTLLAVRSLSGWGYGWGLPLLGGALLGSVGVAVLYFLGRGGVTLIASVAAGDALASALASATDRVLGALFNTWVRRAAWQTGILAAAGLAFTSFGFVAQLAGGAADDDDYDDDPYDDYGEYDA